MASSFVSDSKRDSSAVDDPLALRKARTASEPKDESGPAVADSQETLATTVDGTVAGHSSEYEGRETWSSTMDFLLACIGFSVGLGNVWRFPYLCYKNGGGAFLIPYFIAVVIGGIPMFYLEIAVGQYMSNGGLQAWNIVPIFQGIGLATCIVVFYLNCYYNVIMAWALYYFFASFTSQLPWVHCNNAWNTDNCSEDFTKTFNETGRSEATLLDPVTEYWENNVLDISDGIHNLGKLNRDLATCLLLAWVLVYLCICKGIKSSGKVVYFTATSPYFFMIVLLIRSTTLDGAGDGMYYYLHPNITKLSEIGVWVDAGTQIFFSCSIGLGTLTALGSYNKFAYNSYRDAILFNCVNSSTSILAGFIVFSSLGFMAKQQNRSIADVAESGPGLAFIAYPKAVAQMPVASLWSVFFFFMVILLGLDSQFVGVEGVITTVVDQYPRFIRRGHRKHILIVFLCLLMFLVGLLMVCQGGMYVFQLFDYYSGSRIILLLALLELLAISYVYGINRFQDNVRMMIGDTILLHTLPYLTVCWTVLSPLFCIVMFVLSVINYTSLTYSRPNGRVYHYPDWSIAIGWLMALSSAVCVPVVAIYKFLKHGATYEIFKMLLVPYKLHVHQMRPEDHGEQSLHHYLKLQKVANRRKAVPNSTSINTARDHENRKIVVEV